MRSTAVGCPHAHPHCHHATHLKQAGRGAGPERDVLGGGDQDAGHVGHSGGGVGLRGRLDGWRRCIGGGAACANLWSCLLPIPPTSPPTQTLSTCRISATTPAVWGEAMEVPLMMVVAVSLAMPAVGNIGVGGHQGVDFPQLRQAERTCH